MQSGETPEVIRETPDVIRGDSEDGIPCKLPGSRAQNPEGIEFT